MAQSKYKVKLKIEVFDGVSEEWRYYCERLKIALRNEGIKSEDKKRDLLLGNLGPQPFKVVVDHVHPEPVSNSSFTEVLEILNKYYTKQEAPLAERVKFSRRFRLEGEPISQFELALRALAGHCEFADNLDERLRDQFILGINNDKWQLDLLRLHSDTKTTKLADVVKSALLLESVDAQQSQFRRQETVCRVKDRKELAQSGRNKLPRQKTSLTLDRSIHCMRCGYRQHRADQQCPARNAECRACGGMNHFARACIKEGNATVSKAGRINKVNGSSRRSSSSNSSEESSSEIDHVRAVANTGSKIMIPVVINNYQTSMLYDPGAAYSIIGKQLWTTIGSPKLTPTTNLMAYTGLPIKTLGRTSVTVTSFGTKKKLQITVVEKDDLPLFGVDWVLEFKLPLPPGAQICTVTRGTPIQEADKERIVQNLTKDFHEVFGPALGTMRNCKLVFHMDPHATPIVSKPRPVPFALRHDVEKELERLVDMGVLREVVPSNEPVKWASPVVLVVKPSGAVRICGDFKRTINKYMIPDKHPLPTFEEITSKLAGGQEFTVIDLKDAYLQMEVDDTVQEYLVIATHKGYFKYTRMPFGIKVATAAFQRKMDHLLAGLEGVAWLLDDIIITANTRVEHVNRVKGVLQRLQEEGIRAQPSKCKWFQPSTTYLGHRIDSAGIHPTGEHLEALRAMPSPKNVRELKSFLGSINYYGKFIPRLQSLCVPLHNLLRKGITWKWSEKEEGVAKQLKQLLSSGDTLAHYDPALPVILATDASDVGLGAALFHKYTDGTERPLAFASRRLKPAESRYSVVDKEALAVVFGVSRFTQYLAGRKFEIRTDHKPLIRLFGEHDEIPKVVSNRLSRWALTLSAYDYTIRYQNGSDNAAADFLSRFPINSTARSEEECAGDNNKGHLFHLRAQDLPVSTKALKHDTAHDPVLARVIQYTQNGWPADSKMIPEELAPYQSKKSEISFENGILLWLGRMIIPRKLRGRIMDILHEGHPGIVAIKAKARFQVWWPRIDQDLEDLSRRCVGCQQNRSRDPEVPLFSWSIPTENWSRIHIDFAGPFQGKMWLIVVDARSKWLEVIQMSNTYTTTTIRALEDLFARFGLPRIIVSDNGPQLTSHEFESFCKRLNIKHARITPYHPKSNGLAERCVRTFKEHMKAANTEGGSLHTRVNAFLMSYRTSPKRSTGKSPAQMLFAQDMRTHLDLLRPQVEGMMDEELVRQRLNKTTGKMKLFEEGEDVWVLNNSGRGYTKGQVTKTNGPYSYEVKVDGVIRRKHADQLRTATTAETL